MPDAPSQPEAVFRPARATEMWDILDWRNAPRVRQAMLTQHEIGRAEHEAWFTRKLDDPGFRQMITERDGQAMAVQAYFDIQPRQSAWWAFYFTPAVPDDMAAMMKIWKWVELSGIAYAFEVMGLETLYCEVLRSNGGVLNWHKRFGFAACDPAVSANSGQFDLEVMSLDRATYDRLRAGRNGQDIPRIDLQRHRFDQG